MEFYPILLCPVTVSVVSTYCLHWTVSGLSFALKDDLEGREMEERNKRKDERGKAPSVFNSFPPTQQVPFSWSLKP